MKAFECVKSSPASQLDSLFTLSSSMSGSLSVNLVFSSVYRALLGVYRAL